MEPLSPQAESDGMDTHIVIIGSGNSGTLAANRLRCYCVSQDVRITVVDRNDTRDCESELLTAIGLYGPHTLQAPEHLRLRDGIGFRRAEAVTADIDHSKVCLADGTTLDYDILVVATGARSLPGRPGAPAADRGSLFVTRSPGLGDEQGLVKVDPPTRRSRTHPRVYAIGSAGGGPHPTGPLIHAQAEKLARAVREHLAGDPPSPHAVTGQGRSPRLAAERPVYGPAAGAGVWK